MSKAEVTTAKNKQGDQNRSQKPAQITIKDRPPMPSGNVPKGAKEPREPLMMVVCGMKGVGKTYTSIKEIERYLQTTPTKKGRKVLVFDVNAPLERSYEKFVPVAVEDVSRLKATEARRVVPLKADGQPMTIDEKCQTLYQLLTTYTNGMLVMEDINNYVIGVNTVELIGAITTNRHRDLDLLIHYQSLSALHPRVWQNCSVIRFHHQLDDIDRYRNRIPNYELMKLAQLIVDEQYNRGNQRYFVYVRNLDNKIIGTTPYWFRIACEKYLIQNKKILKYILAERNEKGKPKYDHRSAIDAFCQMKMHYIQ